jgi:hypothetical protein
MIDYEELNSFVPNSKDHVSSLLDTFAATVKACGPDSFVPMCIFLDSDGDTKLALTSRKWTDKDDMYKSFAEMLYAFSATGSDCFIFANDVRVSKYTPEEPHSKTVEGQDAINIAFVSKDSSALVSLPYSVEPNNVVNWHHDLSLTSPLSKSNPTEIYQGDMVELFYVMSHINSSPFSLAQLINYYNLKGFQYNISNGTFADTMKIKVENHDDSS